MATYLWKVWLRPEPELSLLPRALDVQAFRVAPGRTVLDGSRCSGNPGWRFYLGLSGAGEVRTGGTTIPIAAGFLLAVPLATGDLTVRVAGRQPWSYIHVTLVDGQEGRALREALAGRATVSAPPTLRSTLEAWRVRWQRVVAAHPADRHLTPVVAVPGIEAFTLAAQLITLLGRAGGHNDATGTPGAARVVAAARDVVAASRRCDLSAKELASALAISRKHLSACFAAAGLPGPYHWLRRERMARAAALVASDDRPITDIARDLGFTDASTFARVFRAVHGTNPVEWRRRHLG